VFVSGFNKVAEVTKRPFTDDEGPTIDPTLKVMHVDIVK